MATFLWGLCTEDILYKGSHCAKSHTEKCDGTSCKEVGRNMYVKTLEKCKEICKKNKDCNVVSFTKSRYSDCIQYDECPSHMKFVDSTITTKVCSNQTIW